MSTARTSVTYPRAKKLFHTLTTGGGGKSHPSPLDPPLSEWNYANIQSTISFIVKYNAILYYNIILEHGGQ